MKERSYKEMKMNGARHYSELVKMCADARARWHFRRRPYSTRELSKQARRLIRAQGMQMEHKSVDEYIRGLSNRRNVN